MQKINALVIKNSISNGVRGLASSLVAIVLPHYLTRSLNVDRFAAWALLLQVAAYTAFFESGLQLTIARYMAQALERNDPSYRHKLTSSSLRLFLGVAMIGFLILLAIIAKLPLIFPHLPQALVGEFRIALLLLSIASCTSIAFSTFSGALVGCHRNEFVAISIGLSRLIGAFAVVIASRYSHSLIVFAACISTANLGGCVAQALFARMIVPDLRFAGRFVDRSILKELSRFSGSLMVWSFTGLLVSGLDLIILGHFRFEAVAYYSVALYMITLLTGLSTSVSGALMTPIAALHQKGEFSRIRNITTRVTRVSTFVNLLLTALSMLLGYQFLRLWVGAAYAGSAIDILIVLMLANTLRLVPSPYASMLVATGQQKYGILQAVAEAAVNLTASLILVHFYGGMGVALGTLLGAVAGVSWTWIYTMRKASEIPFSRHRLIVEGAARPLMCCLPLLLLAPMMRLSNDSKVKAFEVISAVTLSGLLFLFSGKLLPRTEATAAAS